jgi:hypothetical protein
MAKVVELFVGEPRFFEQGLPRAVVQIVDADGGANAGAEDSLAGPTVVPQGHEGGPRLMLLLLLEVLGAFTRR